MPTVRIETTSSQESTNERIEFLRPPIRFSFCLIRRCVYVRYTRPTHCDVYCGNQALQSLVCDERCRETVLQSLHVVDADANACCGVLLRVAWPSVSLISFKLHASCSVMQVEWEGRVQRHSTRRRSVLFCCFG